MNKIPIVLLVMLASANLASAMPIINNLSVQPSSLWLGESALASLNCIDSGSADIELVYANITGPGVSLPIKHFSNASGNYTLNIEREYLDRTGQFSLTVYCKNAANQTANSSMTFKVSKFTGYINAISPDPAYTKETLEIDFIAKENDVRIASNTVFNVSLNDQIVALKVAPAYDSIKGWMLKIDPPLNPGAYNLKVLAFYDRTNATDYRSVEVRDSVEFSIESVDKTWIKSNETITLTLKALQKGSVIDLNKNNINIAINSVDCEITSISKQGNLFIIKAIAPNLAANRYRLDAYLKHNDGYYSDNETIAYVFSINGVLVDNNNKAMSVQMRFLQNGVSKLSVLTDAYGYYSNQLPPDNYDLEISFPNSVLYLYGSYINTFNDPIKYFHSSDIAVPGVRNAGLYSYEVALSYSNVGIEMSYNEKNILNENSLKVFKCSSWNSGRGVCTSDWGEVNGEIDVVRNKVRLNSTTLSAFVIGEEIGLNVDFSLDKASYNINDRIVVRGLVKDQERNSVSNVSLDIYVKNTQISSKAVTDENGVFSIELNTPGEENSYELVLNAKRYPYKSFSGAKKFDVAKSRAITIGFPETVKVALGQNMTQELSLTNAGQADIDNLKVYLEGLPENYYSFYESFSLKSGEKKTFHVVFSVPFYAEIGVSSAAIRVEGDNVTEEKVFGVNIFNSSKNRTETNPSTGLVSGITFPEISYLEVFYIIVFATTCFSAAVILKKMKIVRRNKEKVSGLMMGAKNFLNSKSDPKETESNKYDRVILTEFPNFLRFSKKLVRDEDGKDN